MLGEHLEGHQLACDGWSQNTPWWCTEGTPSLPGFGVEKHRSREGTRKEHGPACARALATAGMCPERSSGHSEWDVGAWLLVDFCF